MHQLNRNQPWRVTPSGRQRSEPRGAMGTTAPHRAPRLRNQVVAALIRRPVTQARGGIFLLPSGASHGTSAIALPVARSDQHEGDGNLYGRHVATDRFPRGGWGSDELATFFGCRASHGVQGDPAPGDGPLPHETRRAAVVSAFPVGRRKSDAARLSRRATAGANPAPTDTHTAWAGRQNGGRGRPVSEAPPVPLTPRAVVPLTIAPSLPFLASCAGARRCAPGLRRAPSSC